MDGWILIEWLREIES